jgi:preprotein translocase subunit SecA
VWKLLTNIFGSRNQRLVKELSRTVAAIAAYEPALQDLPDDQFPERTRALKARFAAGTRLDDLIP